MIRRRHGVSLSRTVEVEEDVNPNVYTANIADCMLVLLLGLIVALISYYNIDLAKEAEPEITGIEVNMDEDHDGLVDGAYQKRGSVYYDERTGEYYFVTEGGAS